ncbi:bardet-Biedl syndrome 7 protein [Thecamonas trahens ATCC 50062]|uniref:Bardet-Biedl syndrome 7 protein n=1 Tax=Thecamonas trahens ATCC 50062 TaxID=461836 RepID=A0A0L0DRW6_THETB|nr:bardet-Biedl syndrome 7 protein [Thecamonas trahens ATCC 50062]KNC54987.1 bardet-Biedl syndrome 7 protein [Thecamonas trahens ATCC 50062]|eukprot:XP_013753432.1 bardet-Biedl syndrome 7 protein [Thecamonas trahens ATCC 50062]
MTLAWVVAPGEETGAPASAARSLSSYDLLNVPGSRQLVVGSADGHIVVYTMLAAAPNTPPTRVLGTVLDESVSAVVGGVVDTEEFVPTIVAATFSGKIMSLTPAAAAPGLRLLAQSGPGRPSTPTALGSTSFAAVEPSVVSGSLSAAHKAKLIDGLEKELVALRFRAREAHIKYVKMAGTELPVVRPALSSVNTSLQLDTSHAAYVLTVESAAILDSVLIQSDVPLEISHLALPGRSGAPAPVISRTSPPPGGAAKVLVTFDLKHTERRLSALVRSIEGQSGTLKVYAVMASEVKSAILTRLPIKPLSLHARVPSLPVPLDPTIASSLALSGDVALSQLFAWVSLALPNMPDRMGSVADGSLTYYFKSVYLGTALVVEMGPRPSTWARFTSESPSTISILREVIAREANTRSLQLSMQVEMGASAVSHVLNIIRPRLEHVLALSHKIAMLEGLKELAEAPDPKLEPELAATAANADALRTEWKDQASTADFLLGVLTDLYIDQAKFRGIDGRESVKAVVAAATEGRWDDVYAACP